jgi:hypothetical protein
MFWAVLLGGGGMFLVITIVQQWISDRPRALLLPEAAVGLMIALPFSAYGGYCLLRAFEWSARVVISADGFAYKGIFWDYRFAWSDIVEAGTYLRAQGARAGGFAWIRLKLREGEALKKISLDLSGLAPNWREFLRFVRASAKAAP